MGFVDLILNLAGLLLWMTWRSLAAGRVPARPGVTLAATLTRADPRPSRRWPLLAALLALVIGRSLVYWEIGASVEWTPVVTLASISVPFRSDYLSRMAMFSVLSFLWVLGGYHLWLICLSLINSIVPGDDPPHRWISSQLGRIDGWHWSVRAVLPFLVAAAGWSAAVPGLAHIDLMPSPVSAAHWVQQALILGLESYLPWRIPVAALLLAYILNSYLYLGEHPVWLYVQKTVDAFLRPFASLPLRIGRVDLRPLLGLITVLGLGEAAALGLGELYRRLPL